jgi:uncharacterized protein YgiM (DUF1202 family)
MQGDTIIVAGETPNWYMVEIDGYEINGYVSKQFVSEEEVTPKTDEERQAAIEQEISGSTVEDGETTEVAGTVVSSSVDEEYGVGFYAEPFEIEATAGANVRQAPSSDGEIINTIASGTVVTVTGYTDRWYKIEYDGTVGYVNQNLFATE